VKYDDQRSTVLAVDNFNGAKLLGRTLRVDHSRDYRQKKKRRNEEGESEESEEELDEEGKPRVKGFNVAPKGWLDPPVEEPDESEDDDLAEGIDPDDPMRDYLIEKRREERGQATKEKKHRKKIKKEDEEGERKHKHRHHSSHRSRKDGEERHRRHHRHSSDRRRIEDRKDEDGDHNASPESPRHPRGRDGNPEKGGHSDRDDTPDIRRYNNSPERRSQRGDTPDLSRNLLEDTPETPPRRGHKDDGRHNKRSNNGDGREGRYPYDDD
jgi:RNA-binding motif protein, X-linked 2